MFNNAKQHLKRPKITLLMGPKGSDNLIDVTRSKRVRFSLRVDYGRLYMNGEGYGSLYGWVDLSTQELVLKALGRANQIHLMELLSEFSENPKKVAILHGKLTGNCCFCSLPLSDDRSLKMGYGPICADHWHLPWGEKSKFSAEIDWVAG